LSTEQKNVNEMKSLIKKKILHYNLASRERERLRKKFFLKHKHTAKEFIKNEQAAFFLLGISSFVSLKLNDMLEKLN
jgi:hypothetical protein